MNNNLTNDNRISHEELFYSQHPEHTPIKNQDSLDIQDDTNTPFEYNDGDLFECAEAPTLTTKALDHPNEKEESDGSANDSDSDYEPSDEPSTDTEDETNTRSSTVKVSQTLSKIKSSTRNRAKRKNKTDDDEEFQTSKSNKTKKGECFFNCGYSSPKTSNTLRHARIKHVKPLLDHAKEHSSTIKQRCAPTKAADPLNPNILFEHGSTLRQDFLKRKKIYEKTTVCSCVEEGENTASTYYVGLKTDDHTIDHSHENHKIQKKTDCRLVMLKDYILKLIEQQNKKNQTGGPANLFGQARRSASKTLSESKAYSQS